MKLKKRGQVSIETVVVLSLVGITSFFLVYYEIAHCKEF